MYKKKYNYQTNDAVKATCDNKHKQKGATMLEIGLFLLLAGLTAAGVTSLFLGSSSSQTTNQLTSEISGVRSGVKSLFRSGYGTGNALQTLETAKRLPTAWTTTGSGAAMTATSGLGGPVGVTGATSSFSITYDDVPEDVCTGVLSQQLQQNWLNIYVGATAGNATPLTSGALTSLDVVSVGNACAGANKKITLSSN
jgi:type II secretory pathway pseudopilin PulG